MLNNSGGGRLPFWIPRRYIGETKDEVPNFAISHASPQQFVGVLRLQYVALGNFEGDALLDRC